MIKAINNLDISFNEVLCALNRNSSLEDQLCEIQLKTLTGMKKNLDLLLVKKRKQMRRTTNKRYYNAKMELKSKRKNKNSLIEKFFDKILH